MDKLEDLYEINPDEAIIGMINLYSKASEVYNHEVCDAIDLWIYETKNKNVLDYLDKISAVNPTLNKQYKKWISWINE